MAVQMAAQKDQVDATLQVLLSNMHSEIVGAACVSMDGIVFSAHFAPGINIDRVGAVAATTMGVTKRVGHELRIGSAEEVILRAPEGLFMVMPVGNHYLLAVCMGRNANMGLVRLQVKDAAQAIAEVLGAA